VSTTNSHADPSRPAPDGHRLDTRTAVEARTRADIVREGLLLLPNLGKLLFRLMRDGRVPPKRKVVMGLAALYPLLPMDVIPDSIPVLGQLDDVLVLALGIKHLLDGAEPEVIAQYWDGTDDALDVVAALVEWGVDMVPGPLRRLVER
jgi:uncharacterized membrane protein YkvA (DUF1232 family)